MSIHTPLGGVKNSMSKLMFLLFVATNLQSPKNEPPIHLYFTSLKKNNSPATFWSQSHAAPSSQILSCSGQKGVQPRYEDLTGSMWNTQKNHQSSYQAPETMPTKISRISMIHHISLMINWLVVSTPLKNISQMGLLFPIYGKIKNVPNHQPVNKINMWLGHAGTQSHGIFLNGPQQKFDEMGPSQQAAAEQIRFGTCGELVLWPMDGMIW